jgi:hypothetical protein
MRKRFAYLLAGLFLAGLAASASYWVSQFFSGELVQEWIVFDRTTEERRPGQPAAPPNLRSFEVKLRPDANPYALVSKSRFRPSGSGVSDYQLVIENADSGDKTFTQEFSIYNSTGNAGVQNQGSKTIKPTQSSRVRRLAMFSVPDESDYRIRVIPGEKQSRDILKLTLQLRKRVSNLPIALFLAGAPCMMIGLLGMIIMLIFSPKRVTGG